MGPDNRATDVTLPAICSPRQPCPPPPSTGEPGARQGCGRQRRQGNDTGCQGSPSAFWGSVHLC